MLFLIPARAGSKRLPWKNRRLFCGLPLYQWSVATALRVSMEEDDVLIVSTDDELILNDCTYAELRPPELCTDESTTQSLIDYYFNEGHEEICLLQPTSPLRSDSLVSWLLTKKSTCRTVSQGKPTGDCYIYYKKWMSMEDVDIGYDSTIDIDTYEDFINAEREMRKKFL